MSMDGVWTGTVRQGTKERKTENQDEHKMDEPVSPAAQLLMWSYN